jgi:uncharacterized protein (DUF2267 family)
MDFNKHTEKGNLILDEVAEQLGIDNNRDLAFRVLRSVLHALRERLPIQESFHLLAELPFIIKALYVEGWKYHDKPNRTIRDTGSLIREMIHEDYPAGHHDFMTLKDGENALRAVITVLKRHISAGESADIENALPANLKGLWQGATA